jgi:putative IMPACT (imprinted ancient) family translation regulator
VSGDEAGGAGRHPIPPDSDSRLVPVREGRSEIREKGSRFFGFAAPAASAEAAEAFLERLRRKHHDATHVAFALKLGGAAGASKCSDDGEPSGTAGRPIAAAAASAGLTDVVVAVVRYFGGTKLGTGGLARAYRAAAALALAECGAATVYDTVRIETRPAHARAGVVRRLIDPPHVRLAGERFEPEPVLELEVRRSMAESVMDRLREERIAARRIS